jgi:chromosome transmission fidelity protein 1
MAEELKAAFPYPPYDIQQQFMINVVDTLEKKQIGLFESPTGVVEQRLYLVCFQWCITAQTA